MYFPDQSHINRVRDALWQRSAGATVMVGAGFSRNAARKRPDGLPPPTWRDLVEAMSHKLSSLHEIDGNRESTIAASSETSGALRLAQEYKAAFGQTDLHGFLRNSIRDDDFRPGPMHERLLGLPWRDVFTTNWDTLLERARPSVTEQSYSVMRSTDEIPLTSRPRIVKLHGSVDAHFPLVFTEEDYRTYPSQFAPFVNTVQQAMMETVFFLIGFSGHDPNFLHWSGWVRDNLGDSAPKIYLAGWLGLSIHRRRMLEDRNVVPIDLAKHPRGKKWPEHTRDQRSTDWILHTLETGRPYESRNWPLPSTRSPTSIPSYLEPVERKSINSPKVEPQVLSTENQSDESKTSSVRDLIEVWNYNRKETYPGWLTAPTDVRHAMWTTKQYASQILKVLPTLDLVDRLNALRELIWRWEIQLEPISALEPTSAGIEKAAQNVLDQIDCESRKLEGKATTEVDWSMIAEAWVMVASALVTAARFRFTEDEFNRRLSALVPFENDYEEVWHRIRHEKCLWAIYSLDYSSVEDFLENWNVEHCDPAWMMRKSALLFEIGQYEKAQQLNAAALVEIRSAAPIDHSVAIPSREAWALCCSGETSDLEELWHASIESQRRWDELTRLKCNPRLELRYQGDQIMDKNNAENGKPFDLGLVRKQLVISTSRRYLRWAASHRAIRLSEIVGLPPATRGRRVASENLELAARQLSPDEPELAARLVLRCARKTSGTVDIVLSRTRVATIPQESIEKLEGICIRAIEFILPRIDSSEIGRKWLNRLSVVMEALSRFVLRLDPVRVDSIFSKALKWYENKAIGKALELASPVEHILSRCWEALPEEGQMERLLDLLSAPIVGLDGFTAGIVASHGERVFLRQYPDPCDLLISSETPTVVRTSRDGPRWSDAISFLVRGLRQSGSARQRAANRLYWLFGRRLLTRDEESEFCRALWGKDYSSHNELPIGTTFEDWMFITLPEPCLGISEHRFRVKWLQSHSVSQSPPPKSCEIFAQVGSAIRYLMIDEQSFSLSNVERAYLAETVKQWAEEPIPTPFRIGEDSGPIFYANADRDVYQAIDGLQYLLLEIDIGETVSNTLYEKAKRLNESELFAHLLLVGLIRSNPDLLEDIAQVVRLDLASDNDEIAKSAVMALTLWIQSGNNEAVSLEPPPSDLVREVGVIITTRRKAALIHALQLARKVFSSGNSEQRDAIGDFAIQGLDHLAQELQYDRKHDENMDVPLLRWACTHLAIAMADHGLDAEPAVSRWIEDASNDPLPEIRHTRRISKQ